MDSKDKTYNNENQDIKPLEWKRVSESHPPRSIAVLIVSNLPEGNWYRIGTYDIDNNKYYLGSNSSVNPTHWMALPDFPL